MNRTYTIELLDTIITLRFNQNPTVDDIRASLKEASKINPGDLRLWDFSRGVDLTVHDVKDVAHYAKAIQMQPGKVAIIAPQDLTFGLFRVYMAHRNEARVTLDVFRTEEEGIDWLKRPGR